MPNLENNLILRRCPHCNVDSPNLVTVTRFETINYNGTIKRTWACYSCQRCGGVITAWASPGNPKIQQLFPPSISLDDSIPERAKAYLNQAIDSLHAPAGSIMLSASSVDAMLKEKGYKQGSLYKRINQAAADHLITKEMADWAHEVRLEANDQRHPDEDAILPGENDAQKTIDFTLSLTQFLFVMPSRVQKGIQDAKQEQ
ncbi:DUF4145 domain-containing protein [bacterium]|nr:DUF4145 domain-containing protein [bacterium]